MSDYENEMSPEERAELLAAMLGEFATYVQLLNTKLVEAETAAKQGKSMSDDDLHEMFRAAHNMKGMAAFAGLKTTTRLTHEMETVLQKLRTKEISLDVTSIDVLFEAFDALEEEFTHIKETGDEIADIGEVFGKISRLLTGEAPAVKPAAPAPAKEQTPPPAAPATVPPVQAAAQTPAPAPAPKKPAPPLPEDHINPKYLAKFVDDALSNIDVFNNLLLACESGQSSDINELFRIVHTLKGSAGLIGAARPAAIAHKMENIMALLRERKAVPNSETVSVLFSAVDAINDILTCYRNGTPVQGDDSPLLEYLDEHFTKLHDGNKAAAATPAAPQPAAPQPTVQQSSDSVVQYIEMTEEMKTRCSTALREGLAVFQINGELEAHIPMKSIKALIVTERLARSGQIIAVEPQLDNIDDAISKESVPFSLIYVSAQHEKDIKRALILDGFKMISIERLEGKNCAPAAQVQPQKPSLPAAPAEEKQPAKPEEHHMEEMAKPQEEKVAAKTGGIELSTIRIDSNKLDNLMNLSGELVIVRARYSQIVGHIGREISAQREIAMAVSQLRSYHQLLAKEVGDETKGRDHKLNGVLNDMNSKLGMIFERVSKGALISSAHSLDEVTSMLGKISSDIQTGVMQARMVPIEGVFTRFKRIVRDISKQVGKEVNFVIEGEETELDKKIVDSLGDPLTHMVRNAIDHGIEDSETRVRNGKSSTGRILLRASHKGNSIWIEVQDDGRGMDAEKIGQHALKKGIVTESQLKKMSDIDKIHLTFLPGFSTAEKVTDLSGRGVGMDVVKTMISSVNGLIDINTELGKGTTFILKIPLTLAIIKALLVVIGDEIFAFPLESVIEIVKVPVKEIYSVDGNDTIKLREHALSLIELQKVLGIKGGKTESHTHKKVVVVTDGNKNVGVIVDALVGEEEIVIKSLPEHFAHVKGITGASILGDGNISLILDPVSIIAKSR